MTCAHLRRKLAHRSPPRGNGPAHGAHRAAPASVRFADQTHPARAQNRSYGRAYCHRRSEEHTSELQSRGHLVCRLLLEKKKTTDQRTTVISLMTTLASSDK